jgi:hypothetical protein
MSQFVVRASARSSIHGLKPALRTAKLGHYPVRKGLLSIHAPFADPVRHAAALFGDYFSAGLSSWLRAS